MGTPNIGELGEHLTAQWLKGQGCEILASRWRCRWGELDLVACRPDSLTCLDTPLRFVEVKTRRRHNWDAHGLLAVTPQKQGKLYRTAEIFLSCHPQWASAGCRFDLALVEARPCQRHDQHWNGNVGFNQPVYVQGYELTLMTYLEAIF